MKGKTIALLESRMATQLAELVAKRGGVPLSAPALSEQPDLDPGAIRSVIESWSARPAKLAIFQTGVGTRALFAATDALGMTQYFLGLLAETCVVARGPKPTAALRSRGVRIDRNAAEPYTTQQVVQAIEDIDVRNECVVVQRYGETNLLLDEALGKRGAKVIEVPTYRWALPADTGPLLRLIEALGRGEVDAAVFTSASQVQNLFTVALSCGHSERVRDCLNDTLVVSIGPVCSAALRERGISVRIEADPPKLGPLLAALERAFASISSTS